MTVAIPLTRGDAPPSCGLCAARVKTIFCDQSIFNGQSLNANGRLVKKPGNCVLDTTTSNQEGQQLAVELASQHLRNIGYEATKNRYRG